MADNFSHDPGGKKITRLPAGMHGDAEFTGPNGEYRLWLSRRWGADFNIEQPFALWVGLNPSTARGDVNDPTITREIGFTKAHFKLEEYFKVNVMDYRATRPKELLSPGVTPRSALNLPVIREFAARAAVIVVACGAAHRTLRCHVEETIDTLQSDGHKLWCLGKTGNGSPRHPLYLAGTTPLEPL